MKGTRRSVGAARQWIVAEISRLEKIFTTFDDASDLCRWRRGNLDVTRRSELGRVLELAAKWHHQTGGAFNPAVGSIESLWRAGELEQTEPSRHVLAQAADAIAELCFAMDGDEVIRTADCSGISLNAIAKGHIVDRAARTAKERFELEAVMVSIGGDLIHFGDGCMRVGVEDPQRPFDNGPPLVTVELSNEAMATSGTTRRHFAFGENLYSHVLDPRTGLPAESVISATVIGPDTTTADAVATALCVMEPRAGVGLVENLFGYSCLVVDRKHRQWHDTSWASRCSWADAAGPAVRRG